MANGILSTQPSGASKNPKLTPPTSSQLNPSAFADVAFLAGVVFLPDFDLDGAPPGFRGAMLGLVVAPPAAQSPDFCEHRLFRLPKPLALSI